MSSVTSGGEQQQHQSSMLPTTTTFLPILDDLLSPDFRPVTHPPVITPLQTPTTCITANTHVVLNGGGGGGDPSSRAHVPLVPNRSSKPVVADKRDAAVKIQKWWKKRGAASSRSFDSSDAAAAADRVKHSIRHRREEDHIRHLESEISRLKSSLSAERKLRSLQFEAIRSLWSQIQKLSSGGNNNVEILSGAAAGIMSQSLPNGLPLTSNASGSPRSQQQQPQHRCECAAEIGELKKKIESEVGELRELIGKLIVEGANRSGQLKDSSGCAAPDDDTCGAAEKSGGQCGSVIPTGSSCAEEEGDGEEEAASKVQKRPDTLNLNGGNGGSGGSGGSNKAQHNPEELQGYADNMARYVLERGRQESETDNNNPEQQ